MSDDKIRVKDLATELKLTTKEVIAAAKDMGIVAAKVAASNLSEAEAARLRGHFQPAAGPEKQQVIVRRRRKTADDATVEQGLEGTSASDAQESAAPAESKAADHEVSPETEPVAAELEAPAQEPVTKSRKKEPAAPAARIVRLPGQSGPEEEPKPADAEAPAAPADIVAEENTGEPAPELVEGSSSPAGAVTVESSV